MATRLQKEVARVVVSPGSPGDPGSPGQPYRAGYWKTLWVAVPGYGMGSFTYEPVRVWVPEQPYIPPTPPTPPTPAEIADDYQLGWNAGAYSVDERNGDFAFTFVPGVANIAVVVGLAPPDAVPGESYTTIRYGFYIERGAYRLIESGAFQTDPRPLTASSILRLQRKGGRVTYFVDDRQVGASGVPSLGPLQADCALYSGNDVIDAAAFTTLIVPSGQAELQAFRSLSGFAAERRRMISGYGALVPLAGAAEQRIPGYQIAAFAPLQGFADEAERATGRGSLRALQGFAAEPASQREAAFQPLRGRAEGRTVAPALVRGSGRLALLSGVARGGAGASQRSALAALTGEARCALYAEATRGAGRVMPLIGQAGRGLAPMEGRGALSPLRGRANEQGAGAPVIARGVWPALTGRANAPWVGSGSGVLQPLRGTANGTGSVLVEARGVLPGLTGRATAPWAASAVGSLAPLRGLAIDDADPPLTEARGSLPALRGTGRGPVPAATHAGSLVPLAGWGREADPIDGGIALQALAPLRGTASAVRPSGGGAGALRALTGFAGAAFYTRGAGDLTPLQGRAETGLIVPEGPSFGWGVLGWLYGFADSTILWNAKAYDQVLLPLRGYAADRFYTRAEGALSPLDGSAECYPPTYCWRYIPRLLAAALGIPADPFAATLPIGLDAVVVDAGAGPRLRADAWISQPTALSAAIAAQVCHCRSGSVGLGAAVTRARRRQVRVNAWKTRPETFAASLDAVIEP